MDRQRVVAEQRSGAERHSQPQVSTNIPVNTISYTRGNDLSGSLQGAGGWVHGVVEGQAQDLDVEVNGVAGEVAFGPAPITVLDDDVPKGVRSNAQFPTEPARRTMGAKRTDAASVRVPAGGWVTE
ncbi:MAG: hypothetical protein IH623_07775 [Verrucomicrobia bacterium]|nr:hypothetical protein [Verrucomicrobiota bacterium]